MVLLEPWRYIDWKYEDTPIEKPKKITTSGITFGADKKFAEDKFFGLAIRYAENHSVQIQLMK